MWLKEIVGFLAAGLVIVFMIMMLVGQTDRLRKLAQADESVWQQEFDKWAAARFPTAPDQMAMQEELQQTKNGLLAVFVIAEFGLMSILGGLLWLVARVGQAPFLVALVALLLMSMLVMLVFGVCLRREVALRARGFAMIFERYRREAIKEQQ